ncbi:hypothetical protein [Xanthomonas sp. 4461]|uniref:hypothetical protein n=1 Tax=Xanthomonas sp. 4461 TaxID=3035313 RepID=UPI0021670754|nr:hypothetical protein [Xanthomonas sp. 4461]MCS3807822.1 hypothetical protein [Xanthomonas sp. 4461]
MNDIEQRARELLAGEYVKEGRMALAQETMSGHELRAHAEYIAIRAIVAALSQQQAVPEDVKRDAERYQWLRRADAWHENYINKQGAISAIFVSDGSRGHATDLERLDSAIDAAMLAAKPELTA